MLLLLVMTTIVVTTNSIELTGQSIKDAIAEYDLLAMINENLNGIEFDYAEDGFPAYKILQIADIKSPYRMILPEKLSDFAIQTTLQPTSGKGGYLFSVVDPLDSVVQFGVHFSPVIKDTWNVSLLYTDASTSPISKRLVSYQLPYEPKKWITLAFKVMSDKVVYYFNCEEKETSTVLRDPLELVFASSSTLYLAQAGPRLGGNMELNLSLYRKDNGYHPFIYNISVDFCEFQRKRRKDPLLYMVNAVLSRSSNVNHTCPYNHDIIIKDLLVQEDVFKYLPLPQGNFMFLYKVGAYNDWKAEIKVYMDVNLLGAEGNK